MPSHLVEVLFQGVWSSLTGGWFYDTHLSLFINTVHMYTWLFLFALPFVFYIIFPSNFYTWFIYTFTITVLFTIIKLVNHQLNKMFDTNKIMTSEKKIKLSKFKQVEKVITKQKLGTEAEKNESQINGTSQSIDLSTDHMNRSNLIRSNDSIIRQQNTQRSQLIDETILDTETMTVGTNSICIEYSLGSGSFKSKKSKNYLDTVPVCSKTKHRCESKQNEPKAINQFIDDINQFKTTDKFLINEKSSEVNIDITNNCMIEEEMKLNIRKKKKSMEEMSQVNENYIRSLSSPSKLMPDRIRDDYEQAEYLMIDFDYQTDKNMDGKSEKSASNSTEFNIIGLANSLTENIENSSNRSLFKISEESINNIPNNTNSHIFICSKSANELESTTINKISDKSRKTNKNILSKSKRIYSTIDSPKLTKKQAIKKKSLDVETTSISNLIDTENKFQISLSMSSLNLQNSFSKLPRNIENYYDITTSSGKNISRSHTLTSKHIRRAQSDISLNCFEKFIIKNKLSVEDCFYFNKLTKSSTDVRYSNKNSTFARSDFESCISKLINSKYDKRNLERKINILASNSSLLQKKVRSKSNCIPIGTNNMLKDDMRICGESFTSNSDWKRTGAKSSHNLSVFSEFINYSLGISKEDFLQKNNIGEYKESERAASGGMLLSSLSQQLHYEDLNPFKSTLECAKMLRKKKKFSVKADKKSNNNSIINKKLFNEGSEEISITEIREHFITLQNQLNQNTCERKSKVKNMNIEKNDEKNNLYNYNHHLLSIPLAPPPPVPPSTSTINLSIKEKSVYEEQGAIPKNRFYTRKTIDNSTKKMENVFKKEAIDSNSNQMYNKKKYLSNSSIKNIDSIDSIELNQQKIDLNLKQAETNNLSDEKPRYSKHHINYFSSDLTLSNEERMQLVYDDYNNAYDSTIKEKEIDKFEFRKSTIPHQAQPQNVRNSPILSTSRYLTSSASQAANAAVRLIRRDFLDRLTNRGPNRGVYRLDGSHQSEYQASIQLLPVNDPNSSIKTLEQVTEDMNLNEYESFSPSLNNEEDTSSDEKNLGECRALMQNQNDKNEDHDILSIYNQPILNDDYYEEIDENFYTRKSDASFNDGEFPRKVLQSRPHILKKSSLRQPARVTKKTRNELKLSKLRTVPMRYENTNYFNIESETEKKAKSIQKESNDSLNNLDFPTEIENSTTIKFDLLKSEENEEKTSKSRLDEHRIIKGETSNRTYEEIMQVSSLEYSDIDSRRNLKLRSDSNKTRYRIANQNGNKKNCSISSSNISRCNLNITAPTSNNLNTSGPTNLNANSMVGLETASLFSTEEYHSSNVGIQGIRLVRSGKRGRISNRLKHRLDPIERRSQTNPASSSRSGPSIIDINPSHRQELSDIITKDDDKLNSFEVPQNKDPEVEEITKKIYKWKLTNSITLHIPFNHYSLLAMLDRNQSICELIFSIVISVFVSIFTSLMLCEEIYDDVFLIIFCFISASCHYSLLKSVQPDSSSPIHGFNSLTALSRPIYFCLICSLILILRSLMTDNQFDSSYILKNLSLYGLSLDSSHFELFLELLEMCLLFFPILFTLGLFPQISTFMLCIIEQFDMYILGGTAMNNLSGAFLSLIRSLGSVFILGTILICAIYSIPNNNNFEKSMAKVASSDNQFSKSVIFSIFCAMLVLFSYFMSRQTSDLLVFINAMKDFVIEKLKYDSKEANEKNKLPPQPIVSKNARKFSNTSQPIEFNNIAKDFQSKSVYLSVPDSSKVSSNLSRTSCQSNSLASVSSLDSRHNSAPIKKSEEVKKLLKKSPFDSDIPTDSKPMDSFKEDEACIDFNEDILEKKNKKIICQRFESDCLIAVLIFLLAFAIHVTTVFSSLMPILNDVLFCLAIVLGAFNHYILPHLRIENPWYTFSQPILKQDHWSVFEPSSLAKLTWFECIHVVFTFIEKNCLNVLVVFSAITMSSDQILIKFADIDPNGYISSFTITTISLKLMRNSFCEPSKQYQIFFIAYLFHKFDSNGFSFLPGAETILFDLFFVSIFLDKLYDFLEKLTFIFIYTAPWQLPWGSAFHAFAQPLSVPHSALLIVQVIFSSLFNAPLMPLMGSAIFLLSYMRPVKFWEKNYKTKRIDNSNIRLQTQFDGITADSENLNAIFYEHLTSVLQDSLAGDLMLGRWGNVSHGDFFILSSDYLNCLVHIIEIGNGFVTFQLRGLEFKGTYCQQRELEAITEDNTENRSCCCCNLGHLKSMLSFNVAFHLRWVAWSVIAKKYVVNAYRIVDNDLSLIVNFFSLRRTLIEFYLKSAIFYLIKSPKLIDWLQNENIIEEMKKYHENYVEYDACFDSNLDNDYEIHLKGVSISKFSTNYLKWINHCKKTVLSEISEKNKESRSNEKSSTNDKQKNLKHDVLETALKDESSNSTLMRFSFALSLLCRRALNSACTGSSKRNQYDFIPTDTLRSSDVLPSTSSQAANNIPSSLNLESSLNSNNVNNLHNMHSHACVDTDTLSSFQHGYYTLFKGDIRIQSSRDEWAFNDMDILKKVIIPAVRMGLRLHQDHFQNDTNDEVTLYENLIKFNNECVISYERDPLWRYAVLNSVQSLLSLRHQFTEYSDQYKVVMLNKSYLSFRLIKINKECVRSFWAGQQHELIFLRNKNQERGSIQNAKQVLRNIINSSCDQPIGYPIYVSPLTTSYTSSHPQISKIIGPELKFKSFYNFLVNCFTRLRDNCMNDCSGSANTNLFQSDRNINRQNLNVSYASRTEACDINFNLQNYTNKVGQKKLDSESRFLTQQSHRQ